MDNKSDVCETAAQSMEVNSSNEKKESVPESKDLSVQNSTITTSLNDSVEKEPPTSCNISKNENNGNASGNASGVVEETHQEDSDAGEMQIDIKDADKENDKGMKETEAMTNENSNRSHTEKADSTTSNELTFENNHHLQRGDRKRRKIQKKTWSIDTVSPAPKKPKGGLRADCPTFCRAGCTNTHHELLISARRMVENDSVSTLKFLDNVAEYYEGPSASLKPTDLIYDPWRETNYPLLHYLALMGKCAGCFALVDAGHNPTTVLTETKDTVFHTLIRAMYFFNCTHGHMDILLKKFNLLLKEFKDCLFIRNGEDETPFHVCAKLIASYSKLLQTDGKPPFRLYQYLKNMFSSCLEYIVGDEDLKKLNWIDKEGSTVSHYVAEDRASNEILDALREKGVDFSIRNKANKTVDEIHDSAPPPPSEDVLELARLSEKSKKYKSKASSKSTPKVTPKASPKANPKDSPKANAKVPPRIKIKFTSSPRIKITKPRKIVNKTESAAQVMDKTNTVTQSVKATSIVTKLSVLAPKPAPAVVKENDTFSPSMVPNKLTIVKQEPKKKPDKIEMMKSLPPLMPLSSSSLTSQANNSMKARVKFVEASTSAKQIINNIQTEAKIVSPFSTKDLGSKLTTVVKDINKDLVTAASLASRKVQTTMGAPPSMVNMQNSFRVHPVAVTNPVTVSQTLPYPKIANVQSLKLTTVNSVGEVHTSQFSRPMPSSINNQMNSPNTSQALQRPMPPMINKNINGHMMHTMPSNLPQHPISFVQNKNMNMPVFQPATRFVRNQHPPTMTSNAPFNNLVNMQRPIFVKTPDGKLMSLNLFSGNSKENVPRSLAPKLYAIPGNQVPPASRQPGPLFQHVLPPMSIQNNFRYMTPSNNVNPQMIYTFNGIPGQAPNSSSSVVLPPSFVNMSQQMMQTNNSSTNISPISPVFNGPLNNTFLSGTFPKYSNLKPDGGKKNKSLEASIKNLHNNVVASTNTKARTTNNRLGSSFSPPNENAPPVIILDSDDLNETEGTTNSVSIIKEKSSPVAPILSPRSHEETSVIEILKFSEQKKNTLIDLLNNDRRKIIDINHEILKRENDIKSTRETIVEREMEIASYRLKLTNMQTSVNSLRLKRSDIVNATTKLEKQIKAVDDRTEMFQTLTVEGTNI